MDATKLLEKIINLIDLAQKGEIDPWDVQVIEAIDCYLQEMAPVCETAPANYATDLLQSGQAFLSASMLVLFKANTLVAIASPANEPESSTDDRCTDIVQVQSIQTRLPLEQQICRRPAALPPQKRPVTLPELIVQLQLMASQIKSVQAQQVSGTTRSSYHSTTTTRTQALRALELAHQENLTEVAGELEQVLNHRAQHFQQEQDWLNLNQLTEFWTKAKRADQSVTPTPAQPQDLVSVFWALLLLSAQSKVELSQDEFYQEIKIRMLTAN